MITLRRSTERRHERRRRRETWLTFYARDVDSDPDAFGCLEILNEGRFPPSAEVLGQPPHGVEIITYVREGALAYEDWMGRSGVVHPGEFQRTIDGRGLRHGVTNASRTEWAQVFQMGLRPSQAELDPGHEQRRFSTAERHGGLCVVASADGRKGSLRIHQDALIHSALLDPGQHVVHELTHGRRAWLHVVHGKATLGDTILTTGDGVGVTDDRAVSITAREATEILLLDVAEPAPKSSNHRGDR